MLTKKLLPAAVTAAALLGAGQALADDAIVTGDEYTGFTGNVTLTSDYRFRGISQLDGEISPAIQGGFDLALDSGLYAGTWASNVNFNAGGALELDLYAGWAGSLSESVDLDVGFIWFDYPSDKGADLDYWEVYASISALGGTFGVNYADDYFAETGEFWYVYGDYSIPLGETVSLDLHLGYNMFDEEEFLFEEDAYLDYSVGLSASYFDLDWSVAYVGLDIGDKECFGAKDICDDTVVVSVSKSL